jgi:Bardet-Biedl syndrome 9 protein
MYLLLLLSLLAHEGGTVEHGEQYSLRLCYEHSIQRSAYNMCKGPFGNGGNSSNSSTNNLPHHRDYICVQSTDGMLNVYEHESHAMSFFLPKVLIPAPISYVARTDSFVTVNSTWHLESYKYQMLSASASASSSNKESKKQQQQQQPHHHLNHHQLQADFSYNLGEAAFDIQVGPNYLLVLGERNLFCLSDVAGTLRFMRKLDVSASCLCIYASPTTTTTTTTTNATGTTTTASSSQSSSSSASPVNYILATHSKHLLVHEDVKVKWAAQCTHVPVQMHVAQINGIAGMIVTLSEEGHLACSYLGTEPAAFLSTASSGGGGDSVSSSFDYESAESEYKSLQAKIKSAIMNTGSVLVTGIAGGDGSGTAIGAGGGLMLNVQVPSRLEPELMRDPEAAPAQHEPVPSLVCSIRMRSAAETCVGVRVYVCCSAPLVATPDSFSYASVGAVQVENQVRFYVKSDHQIPYSLDVCVRASYSLSSSSSGTRLAEYKFRLPLRLVVKPTTTAAAASAASQQIQETPQGPTGQPETTAASNEPVVTASTTNMKKITLETSRPCVNLIELLPELASTTGGSGSALVGKYVGRRVDDDDFFIVQTAKSGANRYRIQCKTYEQMCLIVHEFVKRLYAYHATGSIGGGGGNSNSNSARELNIAYNESLPTEALMATVERHLSLRHKLDELRAVIEHASAQFRAVQKRLLIKFKDKSPASLENMDALLEATYRQILAASDQFLDAKRELSAAANSLNCVSSLYALLASLSFKLNKQDVEILRCVMTTQMPDSIELVK